MILVFTRDQLFCSIHHDTFTFSNSLKMRYEVLIWLRQYTNSHSPQSNRTAKTAKKWNIITMPFMSPLISGVVMKPMPRCLGSGFLVGSSFGFFKEQEINIISHISRTLKHCLMEWSDTNLWHMNQVYGIIICKQCKKIYIYINTV